MKEPHLGETQIHRSRGRRNASEEPTLTAGCRSTRVTRIHLRLSISIRLLQVAAAAGGFLAGAGSGDVVVTDPELGRVPNPEIYNLAGEKRIQRNPNSAMAALRYAARKLLLHRTQASVVSSPTVERRLVPRLIHTGSSASGAPNSCLTKDKLPKTHTGLPVSSSASGAPNYDTAKILKIQEEVKKKKQELYDMLAVVERDRCYMRTGRAFLCRVRNLKLLQNLSVDVNPKPFDLKWHIYRKTRILNVWGVYLASIVVGHELGYLLKENEDDDTKIPLVNE